METYHVGLIGLAFFAVLVLLAFLAWRRRIARQESLLRKPMELQRPIAGSNCFYVATTFADRPLDRVIAHGLAHRGHASLYVDEAGLQIQRTGEMGLIIPRKDLVTVSTGSAVIDRAVEKDGLVVVRWRLGSTELETHFRFVDSESRSQIVSALQPLVGA